MLAEELAEKRAEYEKTAKEIIESMAGKARGEIKGKLSEAGIPDEIIKELLPAEAAAAPAEGAPAEGEKPAEGAVPAAGAKEEAPKKEEKKK